jgi:hypothetical protein
VQNIAITTNIVRSRGGSPVVICTFAFSRASSASALAKGAAFATNPQDRHSHAMKLMPMVDYRRVNVLLNHEHQTVEAVQKHVYVRRKVGHPLVLNGRTLWRLLQSRTETCMCTNINPHSRWTSEQSQSNC